MASRAMSYGDYYKNKDRTPGGDEDNPRGFSVKITMPSDNRSEMSPDEMRKAALRRRLMRKKAGK